MSLPNRNFTQVNDPADSKNLAVGCGILAFLSAGASPNDGQIFHILSSRQDTNGILRNYPMYKRGRYIGDFAIVVSQRAGQGTFRSSH